MAILQTSLFENKSVSQSVSESVSQPPGRDMLTSS